MVGMTRDSMVSVVVPLCNEEANLPELRARLTAALAHHEFECILVDDGSTDATSAMIRDVAREDPRFKVVSLSRNFGHQAAIFAGLTFARGACVVVMDGDLQDPPEVIPEMVRAWRKGAEVVYGVRTARKEGWFTRATAAAFFRIQARLTRTRMPLDTGALAAGLGVLLGWMPFVAGVVAALAFLFGLQLLIIGLLGEYVGRVLEEVQNRPIFVVDEVVGVDPAQATGDRRRGAPRTS